MPDVASSKELDLRCMQSVLPFLHNVLAQSALEVVSLTSTHPIWEGFRHRLQRFWNGFWCLWPDVAPSKQLDLRCMQSVLPFVHSILGSERVGSGFPHFDSPHLGGFSGPFTKVSGKILLSSSSTIFALDF